MSRKILQINVTANTGSTGQIAEEIGQLVLAAGWQSYIAYGRAARSSRSDLVKIGSSADNLWHGLQSRLLDRQGLGSRSATDKLIRTIEHISPDLIHLHNIHGYYLNYKILFHYLSRKDIPVVWTFHDCWPFTGHCCYYTSGDCDKWKEGCHHCPLKTSYPASLFADRSEKNYRDKKMSFTSLKDLTIVCVSKWLTAQVKQSFFSRYPIRTLYNGLDTRVFAPQPGIKETSHCGKQFMILGVAHIWDARKGLRDFLHLSEYLLPDETIWLVGLSASQMRGLPENIRGMGRTENRAQLARLYALADVYINFSDQETFGLTIAESLACGTPAIVYDATACPEIVSPQTGFVIPLHDVAGAVEAMRTVKAKGKAAYTRACRQRATELFDKDHRYGDYIKLYRKLLDGR
ncbi:MAG: glycosyltransferase [Bacteroides sp.]|nr:glycosyltransferase [Bacteroides sp.]